MALDAEYLSLMPSLAAIIGQRIRAARKRTGTTQMVLAAASGVPQSTLSGWERGAHSAQLDGMEALMRAMGLDPVELVSTEAASPEEAELIELYKRCDATTQQVVMAVLKGRAELEQRARGNG
jgi:transcriptional regulator with XRE-family HTH domain